jgi:benzoate-CoA ligase
MEDGTTYNAAADLIERNLAAGRGAKTAFIDDRGDCSYAELAERVSRFANGMRRLGVHREQRILLCLQDTIDFPTAFLGAIKAGIVPAAVNTQLSPEEFAFMLADSRARAVVVSVPVLPAMMAALALLPEPRPAVIQSGAEPQAGSLAALLAGSPATFETALTHPDEPCFWLYSSGSTAGQRARSMSTRASSRRRSSMLSRCSASPKATSLSQRRNCSLPMGSATG